MKIGVDLRALQVGHQYRGIGEVVKRTLDDIFKLALKDGNTFLFYQYDNANNPLELLTIPDTLQYEIVSLGDMPLTSNRSSLTKLADTYNYLYGNPVKYARRADVFLQYDYALGVPGNVRTVLVKHDIIPFVFWDQFFESPMVPFKNKAARTTLRTIFHNYRSRRALTRSLHSAKKIATVSEYTRQDIHRHFRTPLKKMQTVHLGVSADKAKNTKDISKTNLPTKPYLLFIGAVDHRRRRVDDLVAAFNNLKADGHDIQLVLVGENFKSYDAIPEGPVRTAVKTSSYRQDIITMGYIDDATKQKLFEGAMAFVFPSVYEGFGIPVLESMLFDCPVIAYKNTSIPEVAGQYALYAHDWKDIYRQAEQVMDMPDKERREFVKAASKHAATFSWHNTATRLYDLLTKS